MIKIDRILCPTDLSTESDEALRYGVALARAYGARLFLLHCGQDEHADDEEPPNLDRLFTASIAPHLGLATMNELDWHGLVRMKVENIGRAIVREAVVQDVDLIVMRSRRRPRASTSATWSHHSQN
jgi:nucleotide-binding universal stress UspA family protein